MILNERNDRLEEIRNSIDYLELLAQLAEECSEAAQAALKLRRAMGSGSPTPVGKMEALNNLEEELTGIRLCMDTLGLGCRSDIYDAHLVRWCHRIEKAKAESVTTEELVKELKKIKTLI